VCVCVCVQSVSSTSSAAPFAFRVVTSEIRSSKSNDTHFAVPVDSMHIALVSWQFFSGQIPNGVQGDADKQCVVLQTSGTPAPNLSNCAQRTSLCTQNDCMTFCVCIIVKFRLQPGLSC
jgi:hypothetical protein